MQVEQAEALQHGDYCVLKTCVLRLVQTFRQTFGQQQTCIEGGAPCKQEDRCLLLIALAIARTATRLVSDRFALLWKVHWTKEGANAILKRRQNCFGIPSQLERRRLPTGMISTPVLIG